RAAPARRADPAATRQAARADRAGRSPGRYCGGARAGPAGPSRPSRRVDAPPCGRTAGRRHHARAPAGGGLAPSPGPGPHRSRRAGRQAAVAATMSLPAPASLLAVLIGSAVPYTRPGSMSGIAKRPVDATLDIGVSGLRGDEQGDLRVHGGPDKAVHHYPFDHYAAWRGELGAHALLDAAGAFGENFSTLGWTEQTVCIGDVVQAGTAVLEVSQGRQPCWKLNDRFDVPDMARRLQASGRTGWYYRVPEPGKVRVGDSLHLLQ